MYMIISDAVSGHSMSTHAVILQTDDEPNCKDHKEINTSGFFVKDILVVFLFGLPTFP